MNIMTTMMIVVEAAQCPLGVALRACYCVMYAVEPGYPWEQEGMSLLEECPHFRALNVHSYGT